MSAARIRIATRGSRLAQAQAIWVATALQRVHSGLEVEILIVRTKGDQLIDSPLARIAGQGAFTREIERALLDGAADLAVHSLKDLPTAQPAGLRLAACPPREDPHDVLVAPCAIAWKTTRNGGVIGTSSLRRQAQILHLNPHLDVRPVRGNVPTRIKKALEGDLAAVILAHAGIRRLGLQPPFLEVLEFADMLPAPGQGSLGLQIREDDEQAARLVGALDDPATSIACRAEREFLRALGGGCRVPIAALGIVEGRRLRLDGLVSSMDGNRFFRDCLDGLSARPEDVGRVLAERLVARGAGKVLEEIAGETDAESREPREVRVAKGFPDGGAGGGPPTAAASGAGLSVESPTEGQMEESAGPLNGQTVIVTRDEDVDGPLSRALLALGAKVVCVPLLEHLPPANPEPLRQAVCDLDTFDWILFTSARGVEAVVALLASRGEGLADYTGRIACVGPATAQRVEAAGGHVSLLPKEAKGDALAAAFNDLVRHGVMRPGTQVLFPRADRGGSEVIEALLEFGAIVHDVEAYRTVTSSRAGSDLLRRLEAGRPHVLTFASASAAEALFDLLGPRRVAKLANACLFATIGPSTSQPFRAQGIELPIEAAKHTFEGLAAAIAAYFQERSGRTP